MIEKKPDCVEVKDKSDVSLYKQVLSVLLYWLEDAHSAVVDVELAVEGFHFWSMH